VKRLFGVWLLLTFFGAGYVLSDAWFFRDLRVTEDIDEPDEAWDYLGRRTRAARPGSPTTPGLSARYLLQRKKALYCDEGALVMATLLRGTGHRTRLVDLIGRDGVSHHTVLEVKENGRWQIFDTLNRLRDTTLVEAAQACGYELDHPRRRPTWSLYRSAYFYNGFLKYLVFNLRGLPG